MILKDGWIDMNNQFVQKDILIKENKIVKIEDSIDDVDEQLDCKGCWIIPGATDAHVHLREPGYSHKETIHTGTMAAAKGGITNVLAMPNLNPVPDCHDHLLEELKLIQQDAVVHVYPYGALSVGQKGMRPVAVHDLLNDVVAFSDDGVGVNNVSLLKKMMILAKKYDFLICSHAEDLIDSKLPQGEYKAVRREIELAKEIGCRYHFCHLSCKESFDEVRRAHKEGFHQITCEVTPHHLFLNETMIKNGNWKMNPPLRDLQNQQATLTALLDGTASIIASDHAPHTIAEKLKAYEDCPNGILGLETMLPLVYTNLIYSNKATRQDFIRWLIDAPNQIFRLPKRRLAVGEVADITCLDIQNFYRYEEKEILSIGKNSPYIGMKLTGFPRFTFVDGRMVWRKEV